MSIRKDHSVKYILPSDVDIPQDVVFPELSFTSPDIWRDPQQ